MILLVIGAIACILIVAGGIIFFGVSGRGIREELRALKLRKWRPTRTGARYRMRQPAD